jgi:putative membrane protein insertion efficiency factor
MTRLITMLLSFYKRLVSPMLPASCRYVPSCSEYAAEAVARHGVLRGSALGLWRLLRCHPFSRGGYDPVPDCSVATFDKGSKLASHVEPRGPCMPSGPQQEQQETLLKLKIVSGLERSDTI